MRSLSAIPPTSVTRAKETETSNTVGELSRDAPVPAVFLDITRTFGISCVPDLFEGMRARPAYLEAAWELFKEDLGLDSLNCKARHIMALAIVKPPA